MLLNIDIVDEVFNDAGNERLKKGKIYSKYKKVKIEDFDYQDIDNFKISAKVLGSDEYETEIKAEDGNLEYYNCTCKDFENNNSACKHIVATVVEFNSLSEEKLKNMKKYKNIIENSRDYKNFNYLVNTFYNEEVEKLSEESSKELDNKGSIRIFPRLIYENYKKEELKIDFKIRKCQNV